MGESEEPSDYGETHAKNLSRREKEDRGCRTRTLGEVQGGEEEGGVVSREHAAASSQ